MDATSGVKIDWELFYFVEKKIINNKKNILEVADFSYLNSKSDNVTVLYLW